MKEKILLFIIGLLVGAILATGAFFIYTKVSNSSCETTNTSENASGQPQMPSGQNGDSQTPPEKPDGDNSSTGSGEEPPAKPEDSNTNSSTTANANS